MSEYTERDIEEAFENEVRETFGSIITKRQVNVGIGIADIIGLDSSGELTVIEIKKGKAPQTVVSQLLSYMSAVEVFIKCRHPVLFSDPYGYVAEPHGIVVAERLSGMARRAATVHPNMQWFKYEYDGESFSFERQSLRWESGHKSFPPDLERFAARIAVNYAISDHESIRDHIPFRDRVGEYDLRNSLPSRFFSKDYNL